MSSANDIVRIEITVYRDGEPEPVRAITSNDEIRRWLSCFPRWGQGIESPIAGGWVAYLAIDIYKGDGKRLRIGVDRELRYWSDDKGDWPLPEGAADHMRRFLSHNGVK